MTPQAKTLVDYIQGRCLWQFASRAWDREDNITNVLLMTGKLLNGEEVAPETLQERSYFADAKQLVHELEPLFPWLKELPPGEVRGVLAEVAEELRDITITHSRNGELTVKNY